LSFAGDLADGLTSLRAETQRFRGAALANNTKKTYKSQINSYLKFCLNFGLVPVPALQETLCMYVAFLARTLSSSSIGGYLNVIRMLHLEAGYDNPIAGNWDLSNVQKGVSRLIGRPPKQKLPMTVHMLLDIQGHLSSEFPSERAFWAACLVAFLGFLRKSTLLPSPDVLISGKFIRRADLIGLSLTSFSVEIRHSKTIQFGQRVLTLPFVASPDIRLCPVRAVLTHLGTSKLPSDRPLFNFVSNGVEMNFTHAFFIKRLKQLLTLSGHPAHDVSCHSFRRGGATQAFAAGLSATHVKLRGDWRSNAYERYISVSEADTRYATQVMTNSMLTQASGYIPR
jgi:hypothetical protein